MQQKTVAISSYFEPPVATSSYSNLEVATVVKPKNETKAVAYVFDALKRNKADLDAWFAKPDSPRKVRVIAENYGEFKETFDEFKTRLPTDFVDRVREWEDNRVLPFLAAQKNMAA
jgi:hypothetical protein